VTVEQPVPLQIPEALDRVIQQIPAKDRDRIQEAIRRLHEANSELWTAEDVVRATEDAGAIAETKRAIDRLNQTRNRLIDRIDEGFTHLAARHEIKPSTPTHTETLGSVIDRLSVLTLREQRAAHLTQTASHEVAVDRLPAIRAQRDELAASLAALAADLERGTRRLPDGRKFKLYGNTPTVTEHVTVSPNLDQVIALGGLSECGKSSSGELLRYHSGTYRLKMSFLLEIAAKRAGIGDPYVLAPHAQAVLLLDGLNLFADAHVEARRFTIESVHSDRLIFALKHLLGERLQIVYLDVPARVRATRSGVTRPALRTKDEVKISRGADRVASGADHVIDNSGPLIALHARLCAVAHPPTARIARIEPAASCFLPAMLAGSVDRFVIRLGSLAGLDLVALTGSAVDGAWLEGWSDIDLLISAAHRAHPKIAAEAHHLQEELEESAGTKVAVTVVTPGEIAALLVQPRVLYALARLGDGRSPALHAAPDLRLPGISPQIIRRNAAQSLPLVVDTLRRMLSAAGSRAFDVRAVYKHIVLVLRLVLHAGGIDATGADTIVDTAEEALSGLGSLELPPVRALAHARTHGTKPTHVETVLRTGKSVLEWYAEQVNPTVETATDAGPGGDA
jgi:predicted nucleotidyltransferase